MSGEFKDQVDRRLWEAKEIADRYRLPELPITPENTPLLSAEDEQRLAGVIQGGLEARESLYDNYGKLNPVERRENIRAVLRGKDAQRDLFRANVGLAYRFANKYRGEAVVDRGDIEQEALLGIWDAAEKYGPGHESGARFVTFAWVHMHSKVKRSLVEQGHPGFRYPSEIGQALHTYRRVQAEQQQALGREPTFEEILDASGNSAAAIIKANRDQVKVVPLNSGLGFGSNREFTSGEGTPWLKNEPDDLLASDDNTEAEVVSRVTLENAYHEFMNLDILSDEEREAIELAMGSMTDGEPMSYGEISKLVGVTRQSIGERVKRGLDKMKAHASMTGFQNPLSEPSDSELDEYVESTENSRFDHEQAQKQREELRTRLAEAALSPRAAGYTERLGSVAVTESSEPERVKLQVLQEGYHVLGSLAADTWQGLRIVKPLRRLIETGRIEDLALITGLPKPTQEEMPVRSATSKTDVTDLVEEKKRLFEVLPHPESRLTILRICNEHMKTKGPEWLSVQLEKLADMAES